MTKIKYKNLKASAEITKGKKGLIANIYLNDNSDGRYLISSFPTNLTEYENKIIAVTLNDDNYHHKQIIINEGNVLLSTVNSFIDRNTIGSIINVREQSKVVLMIGNVILTEVYDYLPDELFERRDRYMVNFKNDQEYTIVRYANLHQHTENSLLDGIIKIDKLVNKTEYCCAITDHGNMYGYMEFKNAMEKANKKPIIGEEFYVETMGSRLDAKNIGSLNEIMFDDCFNEKGSKFNGDHLIVLAKNNEGLKNLIKLSSLAFDNIHRRPHLLLNDLYEHRNGLIVTSACIGSTLGRCLNNAIHCYDAMPFIQQMVNSKGVKFYEVDPRAVAAFNGINGGDSEELAIYKNNMNMVFKFIETMVEWFGEDFYLEVQDHHFDIEKRIMKWLINIQKAYFKNIKIIATTDAHYLNKEDAYVHEVWLCNQTKTTIDNPKHMQFSGDGYYVHTSGEMVEKFDVEYLENTLDIMDKVQYDAEDHMYHLPHFPLPKGFKTDREYFIYRVKEGFKNRFKGTEKLHDKEYLERLQYETKTILKMGWPSYFLIVSDFIAWAKDINVKEHIDRYFPDTCFNHDEIPEKYLKDHEIYIGPGRGSAAGSLVCYCLEITDIDPLPFGLLFERFLSPDRVSMPK